MAFSSSVLLPLSDVALGERIGGDSKTINEFVLAKQKKEFSKYDRVLFPAAAFPFLPSAPPLVGSGCGDA